MLQTMQAEAAKEFGKNPMRVFSDMLHEALTQEFDLGFKTGKRTGQLASKKERRPPRRMNGDPG